jgi:hypothetical protein
MKLHFYGRDGAANMSVVRYIKFIQTDCQLCYVTFWKKEESWCFFWIFLNFGNFAKEWEDRWWKVYEDCYIVLIWNMQYEFESSIRRKNEKSLFIDKNDLLHIISYMFILS